ncbi:MAG: hypothetical protein ABIZ49_03195, partial [Opitutaceae bacterium]
RHIGSYVIDDFKQLSFFRELESAMEPLADGILSDRGDELNRRFRDVNPRCYVKFREKHGRGPFTPADSGKYANLFPFS